MQFSWNRHAPFTDSLVWWGNSDKAHLEKMVLARVRYLFYQPMDKEVKTWPLLFPAKEKPNMEKALFDWPIMLQYEV